MGLDPIGRNAILLILLLHPVVPSFIYSQWFGIVKNHNAISHSFTSPHLILSIDRPSFSQRDSINLILCNGLNEDWTMERWEGGTVTSTTYLDANWSSCVDSHDENRHMWKRHVRPTIYLNKRRGDDIYNPSVHSFLSHLITCTSYLGWGTGPPPLAFFFQNN